MSNIAASTSSNLFYQARYKASAHNEQLRSRESAADCMLIDRGRLYRIESGLTNPYPEEVVLMADLYNAPELRNYYCTTSCPLGKDIPKVDIQELDRIAVKALSSFRKIAAAKEKFLDVVEDGVVTEEERPELDEVMNILDEVSTIANSLRVWAEKNLK